MKRTGFVLHLSCTAGTCMIKHAALSCLYLFLKLSLHNKFMPISYTLCKSWTPENFWTCHALLQCSTLDAWLLSNSGSCLYESKVFNIFFISRSASDLLSFILMCLQFEVRAVWCYRGGFLFPKHRKCWVKRILAAALSVLMCTDCTQKNSTFAVQPHKICFHTISEPIIRKWDVCAWCEFWSVAVTFSRRLWRGSSVHLDGSFFCLKSSLRVKP